MELGVLLAHDKTAVPSTQLILLGLELDTEQLELRLSEPKLLRYKVEVVRLSWAPSALL